MITKEKYLEMTLNRLKEYKDICSFRIDLLKENKELIDKLRENKIVKDVNSEYLIKEEIAKDIRKYLKHLEYLYVEISISEIIAYLSGIKDIVPLLEHHYENVVKDFNEMFEYKKGKYTTIVYGGYISRYLAKDRILEFCNLMGVEVSADELYNWSDNIFETKNLRLKIFKSGKIEIQVKGDRNDSKRVNK